MVRYFSLNQIININFVMQNWITTDGKYAYLIFVNWNSVLHNENACCIRSFFD